MNRTEIIELLNLLGAVLIPLNEKMPIPKGWQQLTESDPEALNPSSDKNIGVVLGLASKGFVDIDIDDMEALALADVFLPETGMEFVRRIDNFAGNVVDLSCHLPSSAPSATPREGHLTEWHWTWTGRSSSSLRVS